jgi:hypothetical protein
LKKKELTLEAIFGADGDFGNGIDSTTWSPDGRTLTYLRREGQQAGELWSIDATTGRNGHLLITHGLSDVNVHLQNTIKMADELVCKGIRFDMMLYPRQTYQTAHWPHSNQPPLSA